MWARIPSDPDSYYFSEVNNRIFRVYKARRKLKGRTGWARPPHDRGNTACQKKPPQVFHKSG